MAEQPSRRTENPPIQVREVILALEAPRFQPPRLLRPKSIAKPRVPKNHEPPPQPQPQPQLHPKPIAKSRVPKNSQSQPQSQPRVAQNFRPSYAPCVLSICEGEDIVEEVRAHFDEQKHTAPHHGGRSLEGCIVGAAGDVYNPKIFAGGSTKTVQGRYPIATLSGRYIIRYSRPVQLDEMFLTFQPDNLMMGGFVAGPLIAASDVQVTLGFFPVLE